MKSSRSTRCVATYVAHRRPLRAGVLGSQLTSDSSAPPTPTHMSYMSSPAVYYTSHIFASLLREPYQNSGKSDALSSRLWSQRLLRFHPFTTLPRYGSTDLARTAMRALVLRSTVLCTGARFAFSFLRLPPSFFQQCAKFLPEVLASLTNSFSANPVPAAQSRRVYRVLSLPFIS